MPAERASTVHRAARVLVAMTFGLVIAGGLVTSRDAGLAVPDWPLSFGTINPPAWYAIENVRTEHGHRLIAGSVALCTLALGWLVHRREKRKGVRMLSVAAMSVVLLQALLGGLRVLELSVDLAMVHACVGQIFFTIVVCLAAMTSPHWQTDGSHAAPHPESARTARMLAVFVVSQLLIGIVLRHEGAAARPLLGNLIFYAHVLVAFLVFATSVKLRDTLATSADYLRSRSQLLVRLILAQLALGVLTFALTEAMTYQRQATFLEAWVPTFHVAIGASILGLTATLLLHARRELSVPADAMSGEHAQHSQPAHPAQS